MLDMVKPGLYELQCEPSGRYLDSRADALYNGIYDDVLQMQEMPSINGKWEISRVGGGYTIKQVGTDLYCAVANGTQFEGQSVVLSSVPTVWTLAYLDSTAQTVIIYWSTSMSNMVWQEFTVNQRRSVRLSKIETKGILTPSTAWRLKPLAAATLPSARVMPGVYSLQNKESGTFVSLAPSEKTIGCWPAGDLKKGVPKWEIAALGDGYSIRMHGTDKYCTLLDGISNKNQVSVSKFPAAWRIVVAESPVHDQGTFCQIYWADTNMTWDLRSWGNTNMTWDLRSWGSKSPATPVQVVADNGYYDCRVFKLGQ